MSAYKRTPIRLWGIILIALMALLFVGCGGKANPKSVSPRKAADRPAYSDQLLFLEGDTLWLFTGTSPGGKWVNQEVKGLETPAEDARLSLPVIALGDDVLICEIEPKDTDKEPRTMNYKLYRYDVRINQLKKQGVFQERLSEEMYYWMAPSWTLISWLPAERSMLFAFSGGGGFAGYNLTRLLDSQRAKSNFRVEEDEKLLEKALGGELGAPSYSPDGKFLVMGGDKKLAMLNRETKQIKTMPAPATDFWAISVAADDATVAWVGETERRMEEFLERAKMGADYYPTVDHFGLVNFASGNSKTWAIDDIAGVDFAGMEAPNQLFARVAYSPKSKNLYFSWTISGSVLVGFDTVRETASIIGGDGGRFTLIGDTTNDNRATAKDKQAGQE